MKWLRDYRIRKLEENIAELEASKAYIEKLMSSIETIDSSLIYGQEETVKTLAVFKYRLNNLKKDA